MGKISSKSMFLVLVALQLCRCGAVMDTKASRLVDYNGLSCPQTDVLFLQTDIRSRIECVTRCSGLSDCECVFYKQGYCQGCQGLCHHGHYANPLPALAGTTYYFLNKKPAISSAAGAFSYGTHNYLIVSNSVAWQNALDHCNSLEATLLYIETGEEFTFIVTQLDNNFNYHIGGTLVAGQWVWSHSGTPINMTWFEPTQPDNTGSCVLMWKLYNFLLADTYCTNLHYFICKSF